MPPHFVLYGGTAIALRLGHRPSVDFDFMADRVFRIEEIVQEVPFLEKSQRLRSGENTLTVSVDRGAPVSVSFFGGIRFGRVGTPDRAPDNGIWIASLLDLAATEAAVLPQRAEAKDYLDLHALLRAGLTLEDALGAARALYQRQFNPAITPKALAYYDDGDLASVPSEVRRLLTERAIQIGAIPAVVRISERLSPEPSAGS